MFGQGIRDVQIFSLLGRTEDAFSALREAIDLGFRTSILFDTWLLEFDPYLTGIRDDPRFAAMLGELDELNAVMRDRVQAAEASGDWDQLTALAGPG